MTIFFLKRGVSSAQLIRVSLRNIYESLQKSYIDTVMFRYHFLAQLLIEAGREEEAPEVLSLLKIDEMFDPDTYLSVNFT
jgi:hypothetical protein